jgi:hypothetical protein
MAKRSPVSDQPPIVTKVFEDFTQALEKEPSVDASVITQLRKVLLEERDYSADAIRKALFSEDLSA